MTFYEVLSVIKEQFFNEVGGVQCLLGMLGTHRSNHRHKTRALRGTTLLSLPSFMSSRINCLRDCCDVLKYDEIMTTHTLQKLLSAPLKNIGVLGLRTKW